MQSAREIAVELARLKRKVTDLETAASLSSSSIEGGFTPVYDDTGTIRTVVGAQVDGTFTVLDMNGPAPVAPADPILTPQPGLLTITSWGVTFDGSDWPLDFLRIDVHVGTPSGFIPSPATKVAEFTEDGGLITLALDPGTYYVVLVAVNTSGNASTPSGEVAGTVTAPVTGPGGVITYYTDAPPVGLGADDDGDLWYETDNGNLAHRWDGTSLAWIALPVGPGAIGDGAIDSGALFADFVLATKITASDATTNMIDPAPAITTSPLGSGSFAAGTYFWVLTAVTPNGETAASNEVSATVAAGSAQAFSWEPVPGATSYKLYRGSSSGGENALVVTQAPIGGNVGTQTTGDSGAAGLAATPPSASRVELDPAGLAAYNPIGAQTVLIDSATGNASFVGEIGTAKPGDLGIFLYSQSFSRFGEVVTHPIIQLNVNTSRDQPSIQAENDGNGGSSLFLFSGAGVPSRETKVEISNGEFFAGIEAVPDDETYTGAWLQLQRDFFGASTDLTFGGNTQRAKIQFDSIAAYIGYDNGSQLRGYQYLLGPDNARILTASALEVTGTGGGGWKAVNASAFNVQSDGGPKTDRVKVAGALAALDGLTVYDYDTPHGAPDGETIRARGVIAQDVEKAAPIAAVTMSDQSLGVDVYGLLATTIAALQELAAEVEALK